MYVEAWGRYVISYCENVSISAAISALTQI